MPDSFSATASNASGSSVALELREFPAPHGGDEIVAAKTYTIDNWPIVKGDGQVMTTFSTMHVTLLHIRDGRGDSHTDVLGDFHQYNDTENDRGDHHASLRLMLGGSGGNILATPYASITITRDACRDLGTITLPQVRMQSDIFDLVANFKTEFHADWNYEGGC